MLDLISESHRFMVRDLDVRFLLFPFHPLRAAMPTLLLV